MGWTILPVQNNSYPGESRSFLYTETFYTIVKKYHKELVFGEKPQEFDDIRTIDMQVLDRRRVYLERLENFPLKKAEYYKELQTITGIKSVRGLSEITGEDWSYIAKVLKTLELPRPIQEFLSTNREPTIIGHFHLRRLLELVRLGDENLQFARFRKMLSELNHNKITT